MRAGADVLTDKKVLITGATGQIGRPIAEALAVDNEVWCAARFSDPARRRELEELGVKTCRWAIEDNDFSAMPDDFTHVMHSAYVILEERHDVAIRVNAEGTGMLMQHCRRAESFVFVSASAVYEPGEPDHPHAEGDPLGGRATYITSYPVAKIASEGVVHAAARMLNLPSTIARMNVGYGRVSHGGLPLMYFQMMLADQPIAVPHGYDNWASPISEVDIAAQGAGPLFDVASVPVTVLNWAGDDIVSHREMCEYMGSISGLTPRYVEAEITMDSFASDNTRRRDLMGDCTVNWRDGLRGILAEQYPDRVSL